MWDKPRVLNWLANFLFALVTLSLLYGLLFAAVHLPIFPIRQVKVEGEVKHVNEQQVKLIVDKHLKGNFFTMDLIEVRNAFTKLPWARDVSVRRVWPDTLSVEVIEHVALARWGDAALVNTYGELFHAATEAELPVFFGANHNVKKVTKQYAAFSQVLNSVDIKIARVSLSARQAWEIKTNRNLLIVLGRVDMKQRLASFAKAYDKVLQHMNTDIKYADLRYPNGFAIRKPKKLSMQVIPSASEKTQEIA